MSTEEVQGIVSDMIKQTQGDIQDNNFDPVSFSRGLTGGINMYLTPQMVNRNLKNVNFNPQVSTYENILKALDDPKNNEDLLISYSQHQYMTNTLFKRNFDYYANLLAFNLAIIPKGKMSEEDWNSKAFKKDLDSVREFLDKFDYRTEFKKAVFNMLNADLYPCILRTDMDEDSWILQDFPYQQALITGKFSHGILCDYDLSFLMTGTQDVYMYPPWLVKKFKNLLEQKDYVPHNTINHRTGTFAFYIQTSPKEQKNDYGFYDGAWNFKFSPDFIAEIPYFAPMAADTSLTTPYRTLQYNQAISSARKIITAQWPLLKDTQSGKQADALAVRSETMGRILGAAMSGLNINSDLFNLLAIPSDKIELHQLENKNSAMYQDYLKTVSGLLGGANMLFTVQKQTATESLVTVDMDKHLMEKIYPQFEKFLDYYINMRVKKYKFKFTFSGTNMYMDKDARLKKVLEASSVGVVSANSWANSMDLNIFELTKELEMTKSMGFSDKLLPMLNIYTKSGGDDKAGRPQSSNSELSESGQETRSESSNIDKGGTI